MKLNLNQWTFFLSLFGIVLTLIFSFTPVVSSIHPLRYVLFFMVGVLFFGAIGLKNVTGWQSALRSAVTIILSLVVSVILFFVVVTGYVLS